MSLDTVTPEPTAADRILAMVDATPSIVDLPPRPDTSSAAAVDAMVPAAWRTEIESAGRAAYHGALGKGLSKDDAIKAGSVAAGAAFDRLAAEAGLTEERLLVPERTTAPGGVIVEMAPPSSRPAILPPDPAPASTPAPKSTGDRGVEVDPAGRVRSQRDVDALRAAGFAPREPLFERGTMVIGLGVDNARKARAEYDRLPLVRSACDSMIRRITGEGRRMVEVDANAIGMQPDGKLLLAGYPIDVTENGFAGMVERLGYGGAAYLTKCTAELRAVNVEAQRALIASGEASLAEVYAATSSGDRPSKAPVPRRLAARVRDRAPSEKHPGGAEVFAMVSTGYPTFDSDLIAEAFAQAMPTDARGTVRYDSATTGARFEALFHSTVAPEHYVAGEVFRTGIRVRANDSGDGSIVVRAVAWQNLCLNMLIIDKAGREIARIRHTGNVEDLRKAFVAALEKARRALAPFLRQWGYACSEDVKGKLLAAGVDLPENDAEVMRGIFAGLILGRKVRFPRLMGQGRTAIIDKLVETWTADTSGATAAYGGVTRAAVVNAFTKTAQGWMDAADPWATDSIELDASRLLWGANGQAPDALHFVDLDKLDADVDISPATLFGAS